MANEKKYVRENAAIFVPSFGVLAQIRMRANRSTKNIMKNAKAHRKKDAGKIALYQKQRKRSLVIFVYRSASSYSVPFMAKFMASCVLARGAKKCFCKCPTGSNNKITLVRPISAIKIAYTPGIIPSSLSKVSVKGVMMVKIMAVLTQRNNAIFKYKDVCLAPSDGCGSKDVNILANNGKTELATEIAIDAHAGLALAQNRTRRADMKIAANVAMVVYVSCFMRCIHLTFKSCQRIVDGSSGSLIFNTCACRNKNLGSIPFVLFLLALRDP
mmetsp:Transcript_20307/g.28713  ORF Transcript_20307/g.28713 Transcript_20307/m.28713 type:complete len:271 (+) Transcript_20307:799-1611(+)